MAVEIERKFLLESDAWRGEVSRSEDMAQGYLAGPPSARCSVRVRIVGGGAFINIKSVATGIARDEYEYAIPLDDARRQLSKLAGDIVEKRRHYVNIDTHLYEIDEFKGVNQGLIVAEIELDRVDATFPRPPWLGSEVSNVARYYNLNLAIHPYSLWSESERNGNDTGR